MDLVALGYVWDIEDFTDRFHGEAPSSALGLPPPRDYFPEVGAYVSLHIPISHRSRPCVAPIIVRPGAGWSWVVIHSFIIGRLVWVATRWGLG